jgi:hypothetical protein
MLASPAWEETLQKRQRVSLAQPSGEFAAFAKDDRAKVERSSLTSNLPNRACGELDDHAGPAAG